MRGALGAVEAMKAKGGGTVGVSATVGTVSSGAYPAAIEQRARQENLPPITVVQQGSLGLAGAIDELPEFIDRTAKV